MLTWIGALGHRKTMPKRSSKDVNQIAAGVLQAVTGQTETPPADVGKNPAAVALGRLGGLKGGKARDKALSKARKAEIAKKAAQARWGKKHD